MRAVVFAALLAAVLAGCTSGVSTSGDKQFVGSEKCKSCHTNEYATWKGTLHSKMIRTAKDGLLKDAGDNWAKDSKGNAGPTKANISGAPAKMEDVAHVA